jgi:hypothetical protein
LSPTLSTSRKGNATPESKRGGPAARSAAASLAEGFEGLEAVGIIDVLRRKLNVARPYLAAYDHFDGRHATGNANPHVKVAIDSVRYPEEAVVANGRIVKSRDRARPSNSRLHSWSNWPARGKPLEVDSSPVKMRQRGSIT